MKQFLQAKNRVAFLLSSSVLIFSLVPPAIAHAFPAYGAGTEENPYRISTCAQLEDINNNMAADYVLVSNIDCTGYIFTDIGGSSNYFTGTLDGQDHTIKNLSSAQFGIFYGLDNATIMNLNLDGGSVMDNIDTFVGGITGEALATTIRNVHSSMSVTDTQLGSYVGGLIGSLNEGSVTLSSYSGDLTANSFAGGLAGSASLSTSDIGFSNDFVTGSLNLVPPVPTFDGGVVGSLIDYSGAQFSNMYSSSTITLSNDNSSSYVGGLIGSTPDYVSNSFSASPIINTGSLDIGTIVGSFPGTITNTFYDGSVAGGYPCTQGTPSGCTAENVGNSDPNYFKNNSINGPFSTWDFNTVWQTTSSYPTLRDLSGFADQSGIPNNGDANGDGIQDSYQDNVADMQSSNGIWATVEVPSSTGCTLGNSKDTATGSLSADTGYIPQLDLSSFDIYCPTVGMTVPVTIVYSHLYSGSLVLRYYNSMTHSYSTVPNAAFGVTRVGGSTVTTATYSITDGGPLDEDASSNGVIVDPVGIAITAPTTPTTVAAPSTGYGKPAGHNVFVIVIGVASSAILVVGAGLVITRRRKA